MKIVELITLPGNQYHFGEILPQAEEQHMNVVTPHPSSDLLFSAMVNIWQKVYGDATQLINSFETDLIRLSSAFFFIGNKEQKRLRFLPKPVVANLKSTDQHKKLKRIAYVSEAIINQGVLPDQWFNPDCCTLLEGNLLCLNEELSHIKVDKISVYKEVTIPKVKVHTLEKENRLYSQSNILFPPEEDSQIEKGYYFYLEENLPPDKQEKFMAVLNLMADEGLGGDRSSGCGLFKEVRITEAPALTETSDYYLSLSLINPAKEEQHAFLYYPIVTRGGRRINSHQRLKMVNMVGEGAILSQKIAGRIVDISPNNDGRYKRYGKAFLYPLNTNIEQLWKEV